MAPSAELLWECMKGNSSFIRKSIKATGMPVFSAEAGNLAGLNSFKYSSLASKQALGLSSETKGKKECIVLTTTHKKGSRAARPQSMLLKTGVNKCSKKGLAALSKATEGAYYRRDLAALAKAKYAKIKTSFKKKKISVKSRRAEK
mmetsp:Transcript_109983/g.179455  ORF Transcript_109983/g.179455 Transcript_109983/m.179455 type:complete len:146 (-) Transcript_109983:77-514(-)